MKTETEKLTLVEELKKEFKECASLYQVQFHVHGPQVFIENEIWNMRNIKELIPILHKYDISFVVNNERTLLLYKMDLTIGSH